MFGVTNTGFSMRITAPAGMFRVANIPAHFPVDGAILNAVAVGLALNSYAKRGSEE